MENDRYFKHTEHKGLQLSEFFSEQNTCHGIIQIGNLFGIKDNPVYGRVYDPKGIAPTLNSMEGGVSSTNDNRNAG